MPVQAQTKHEFVLHPATALGSVHLTTADLDRQITFYQSVLGFKLHWKKDATAGLGAGRDDLLRLTELRGAGRVRGTTGLYHFAVLVPTRWELAHLLRRVVDTHAHIQGMVNHYTHLRSTSPTRKATASSWPGIFRASSGRRLRNWCASGTARWIRRNCSANSSEISHRGQGPTPIPESGTCICMSLILTRLGGFIRTCWDFKPPSYTPWRKTSARSLCLQAAIITTSG